ncbi:MAG: hypothetical protein KDH19_03080 [Geminicoccaceae bacterium]|nr:hypothetical protein [Geminicoccaceae bacterium]MCB2009740.1 hypothetical protein [Geminicoccaceae bacterium]
MRQSLPLLVFAAALALAGCGGEPFEPQAPGEIRDGPGLFTGEDGEFVITPKTGKKQQRI